MKEKRWTRYVAWFIFAVALIVVYKTIDSFGIIFTWFGGLIRLLMPFGLGILLAYMLYFPCRKIEKLYGKINLKFFQKRKRKFSVVTVYVILILAVVILLNVIFPMLYESIIELADSLPNYYNKAVEFLSNQPKDSIITKIHAVDYIKKLEDVDYVAFVTGLFDFDNIGKYIKGITSVAGVIFDIFITIIVSIYILFERNDIKSFLKNLFKATCSELGYNKISRYYGKTNNIFYNYITAQI